MLLSACTLFAGFAQWEPAGDKIKTTWSEQVNPNEVLPEYPRPIMERTNWESLNGLWEYAIEEFYKLKYCSTVVYMVPRA